MLLVGLTGGIGSGKSTVGRLLAERGAVLVDADAIVRNLQRPGEPVFARIVERFGDAVVATDGTLDRAALGAIVFRDEDARNDLNAIVHPEVMSRIAQTVDAMKDSGTIVVLDVPLLVEIGGGEGLDLIVVVTAAEEVRLERLKRDRAMSAGDARARMAAQASEEQRGVLADVVITNDGDLEALEREVDALWERLRKEPG